MKKVTIAVSDALEIVTRHPDHNPITYLEDTENQLKFYFDPDELNELVEGLILLSKLLKLEA